jgi:hypothetical protein
MDFEGVFVPNAVRVGKERCKLVTKISPRLGESRFVGNTEVTEPIEVNCEIHRSSVSIAMLRALTKSKAQSISIAGISWFRD